MSNILIKGMILGKGRGHLKARYSEGIIKALGVGSFKEVARMAEDRACWRKLVKGATADRTRPNRR